MTELPRITRRGAMLSAAALLAAPAISYAQSDVIRIGHLTPRTGFLGPLGEFAVQAAQMASDEINASGGINGRKLEMLFEDSVNPQTASAKAERYIQRDKVSCIVGEINSASALAIGQVVQRERALFINTGANSDALRGSDCRKFMFHIEGQNSMYVKAVGRALVQQGLIKGKKIYALTADYAFGHDLLRVAKKFIGENGGNVTNEDLIPTELTDFSPFLLKLRQARPDVIVANLAGAQITNFLKQYSEFGLRFPVAGFGFDTALAWGAGAGNFLGTWPTMWHHRLDNPGAKKFTADFRGRFGRPPENQAWGDYNAVKILARAMAETKGTDGPRIVEYLESGAKFDVQKSREAYFRARDHQIMTEMYAISALPAAEQKDRYDLFTSSAALPGPDESLEAIASTPEEASCTFPT
ncbi:ABC transporter substrate-binding protein [Pseudoroseomonas deserti]|uniref:ABC transporter substrate-binding protein n=1 Tax=Teichococcus deserti TaxID=1817963 RepID=A0A1V2H500_9PROT|nr:ABC transporter substrate-binding protein [Pseudoroseomonas deserti]ONG56126.1 ABC transporter substrate-binding protein [Pseudoroseomonas deserti]